MVKVKVCGLTRPEDVSAVNECHPDWAGFVFAPSRRQVTAERAAALIAVLAPGIVPVGVFVDVPVDEVAQTALQCGLGAVQLHGGEDGAALAALRARLPGSVAIWKAVRVRGGEDIARAAALGADLLLLDAWSADAAGGTGQVFDWRLAAGLEVPFLLAGGLHPGNVAEAIAAVRPYGVDVSSGVESDGRKDREKIVAFVQRARSVNP